MGFYINEKITVELHWKEVSQITTAINFYTEERKKMGCPLDEDDAKMLKKMIDKMGVQLYDHPDNDLPNGH